MRWLSLAILAAFLAGCTHIDRTPSPEPKVEELTTASASTTAVPQPETSPVPMVLASTNTTSHYVTTHAEGDVAVSLILKTPKNVCDVGALVQHHLKWTSGPQYSWSLFKFGGGEPTEIVGNELVPAPSSHAGAGGTPTRMAFDTVYGTVFGAYWDAFGFADPFTSGSWFYDVDLPEGVYALEAYGIGAVDGEPSLHMQGGSLEAGVDCQHSFEVLAGKESTGAVLVTSTSADGDVDVEPDLGLVSFHQGSFEFQGAGNDCRLRFGSLEVGGTVSVDGATQWTLDLAVTDNTLAGGDWWRASTSVADGHNTISWLLYGAGWSGWTLHLACFQSLPGGQSVDGWSTPE